jgi:Kef-type K+ transport system membrane component KefB
LEFLIILLILLALAKIVGEIFERFNQSEMIGHILVGIVLGGGVLTLFGWGPMIDVSNPALGPLWGDPRNPADASHSSSLKLVADIGVFFLVMMAGLELDVSELAESLRGRKFWIAVLSFVVPYASGIGLGFALGLDITATLVLGTCIAITALPVSVRILSELGLLGTELANSIISAAVVNDIIGIATLALVLDLASPAGAGAGSAGAIVLALKIVLFIALVYAIDRVIFHGRKVGPSAMPERAKRALGRLARFRTKEALFSFAVITSMAFGALAAFLGIHFIIGVFFGALLVVRGLIGDTQFWNVKRSSSSIALGIFAPIFFIYLGLHFDLAGLAAPALVAGVLLAAVLSKIAAGWAGGLIAGFKRREALALGAGLNGRGIMELVIASIALERNLISPELFSVLVLMGLVTTLMTPPLMRRILGLGRGAEVSGRAERPPGA